MSHGSVNFDRIADQYDETRGGERRGKLVAAVLDRYLPRSGLVLEVGVGTGVVALGLTRDRRPVVGVDISPAMLARASGRLPGRVAVGDALRLPVRDASVAAVCLSWVLHLVADRPVVLAEVARVTEPGARVAVVASARSLDPDDPIDIVATPVLEGLRPDTDRSEAVVDWLGSAGFAVVGTDLIVDPYEESPAAVADQFEQRIWSALWSIDDDRWADLVQPAIDALRGMPDPDRPRRRHHRHAVVIAERR